LRVALTLVTVIVLSACAFGVVVTGVIAERVGRVLAGVGVFLVWLWISKPRGPARREVRRRTGQRPADRTGSPGHEGTIPHSA